VDVLTGLPDLPRWVEARGMLLTGRGHIVPNRAGDPPTIVSSPSVLLAVVMRWDDPGALARAFDQVPREFSVVAPEEAAPALAPLGARRSREGATLFHLPPAAAEALPPTAGCARLLRADEYRYLDYLPPILRGELRDACAYSPIACAFVDGRPVAFCYCGWETDAHWDVSIDTLEAYRRRGLASAAATCLLQHMAAKGKTAVWGSVDSNDASFGLAQKLGLTPVDRLLVLYPDPAH
jgi:hypothetical protein